MSGREAVMAKRERRRMPTRRLWVVVSHDGYLVSMADDPQVAETIRDEGHETHPGYGLPYHVQEYRRCVGSLPAPARKERGK